MKTLLQFISLITLSACTSIKEYENESYPESKAAWMPVNPENFGKPEVQRLAEGAIGK